MFRSVKASSFGPPPRNPSRGVYESEGPGPSAYRVGSKIKKNERTNEPMNTHIHSERSHQIRSNQIRSNQIRSDQIRSDQTRPDQIRSDQIRSDQIRSPFISRSMHRPFGGADKLYLYISWYDIARMCCSFLLLLAGWDDLFDTGSTANMLRGIPS